jgi:hypothetical protein
VDRPLETVLWRRKDKKDGSLAHEKGSRFNEARKDIYDRDKSVNIKKMWEKRQKVARKADEELRKIWKRKRKEDEKAKRKTEEEIRKLYRARLKKSL